LKIQEFFHEKFGKMSPFGNISLKKLSCLKCIFENYMVLVEILIQAPAACNKSVVGMQGWSHKGGKCRVKP
jgi:hypothetical protein